MRWCKCIIYPWWCQRTYLPMMQMSLYRDGDAKCLVVQMSSNGHVMMQMLLVGMSWCKCPLGACHDANVLWCMLWCECLFGNMQWCKCPLGACYDTNVRLGVFHDANVPLVHVMVRMPLWWCNECECPLGYAMNVNALLWVYHDTNALMQTQFIQKFFLFSKQGFHNAWNQSIFKLNLLFLKNHLDRKSVV